MENPAGGEAVGPSASLLGEARRRTLFGIRSALVLNAAALPLSFATNMILGRISPEALGAYGAIQILVGTSFMFLVIGGANVFTRFVPALPQEDRFAFLLTYGGTILAVFTGLGALAFVLPELTRAVLERVGSPATGVAVALLALSVLCGMACWFLYAVSEPTWAVLTEKVVVAGFFVSGVLAYQLDRGALARGDADLLWRAALGVYLAAVAMGVWRVTRTPAFHARRPRWLLPPGFWPVVGYTQLENVVSYAYAALAPSVVLFWVDLRSLGHFHAALRYVVLLTALPAAVIAVLGPELRRLVALGHRQDAFRQTTAAIQGCLLVLGPAVLVLIVFAGDAMAVFGPGFREHAEVLRWTAPAILAAPVVLCGAGAALAVGAFARYLRASILYVVSAAALLALLVPRWGVPGAAAATTLGALARQVAITWALRKEGFRAPRRLAAAWVCAAAALLATSRMHPGRVEGLAVLAGVLGLFVLLGQVRPAELRRLGAWGAGRAD